MRAGDDARDAAGPELVTEAELARAAGVPRAAIVRLVRLGVIVPAAPAAYPRTAALRVRRALRLRRELAIGLAGVAVILDLLDRLERLEAELRRTRG